MLNNYVTPQRINFFLAALSGLLLALSFPYPSISVLAWIGVIPLLMAVGRSDFKTAPVLGLIAGTVFFSILLYWILVFGFIAWATLSIYLSLSFILFASGAWAVMRNYKGTAQFILTPSLWAVCEYARSLGPLGFAWGNIGSTVNNLHILRVASYAGELGLGFIIILFNLVLLRIFERVWLRKRMSASAAGVLIILAALAWPVTGTPVTDPARETPGSIRVALVQPSIAQGLKADISNDAGIKARYLDMTREALKSKPELVIWPESTLISFISYEKDYIEEVKNLLDSTKTPLVFGGLDSMEGNLHNMAFYIDERGALQNYRKIHLVPFGEYMPMRGLVERLNSMATLVTDQTPGKDYKVFNIRERDKFSTVICFESSDSALVNKMVKGGARLLVVITNDGWFGETAAAEQHFRITRMRAVEYGIPVIQAANTGISGIIEQNGGVTARTELNERKVLQGYITFAHEPSIFSRFGYMMPYLYLVILLVAVLHRSLRPYARV